ncbi:MAG: dienelactone hydrolase family protein [Candidatus Omnitrophota bacterium]
MNKVLRIFFILIFTNHFSYAAEPLPGTQPLQLQGDYAAMMVEGIDAYLMRENENAAAGREQYWKRDFSSPENYAKSIEPNRERLRKILGIVDSRDPVAMQFTAKASFPPDSRHPALIAQGESYAVYAVRWNVFRGVEGEGLLLEPAGEAAANVIALPDCDWTPEMFIGVSGDLSPASQFARRLAENGCRVLVPVLINRRDDYSGLPGVRMTNQPHREFLWRAAYEMGRHIIGYEIQKVLAAVDWFERQYADIPLGVIGYGEGGLIAFYSAAVDARFKAAAVSGYFQPREKLWSEPIYRNVWSLLQEFGDAEIAGLIAPRPMAIEACRMPEIDGPPQTPKRSGGAPGIISTPPFSEVEREVERARALLANAGQTPALPGASITLVHSQDAAPGAGQFFAYFMKDLVEGKNFVSTENRPTLVGEPMVAEERFKRQFDGILEDTQWLMRESEFTRKKFWSRADVSSLEGWKKSSEEYREYFWDEIIGRLPAATVPTNPHTRLIYDEPLYKGYQVMLDVYPGVFAYGILLVPKDILPGERRPVVVCQHGLEGRPEDLADPRIDHPAYHAYACRLAERGFVVFAPQNPYIGEDRFRVLLRKGQPIKKTLYSFIVRQHESIVQWLGEQPFADPQRIAFYGLSYGGKTAMRIPALLDGYCISICSADYNEWIWKNVSARHSFSYLFTGEYDMAEFDLGNTYNYAEMSWLIFPRPFMVERGHDDGVSIDEWVAYEYARTRRFYDKMGLGDRTEIEFFNGPHTIHGVGTFAFLHRWLNWPFAGNAK